MATVMEGELHIRRGRFGFIFFGETWVKKYVARLHHVTSITCQSSTLLPSSSSHRRVIIALAWWELWLMRVRAW